MGAAHARFWDALASQASVARILFAMGRDDVLPTIGFLLTVWLWTSLAPHTVLPGRGWILLGLAYLVWTTRASRRPVPRMHLE